LLFSGERARSLAFAATAAAFRLEAFEGTAAGAAELEVEPDVAEVEAAAVEASASADGRRELLETVDTASKGVPEAGDEECECLRCLSFSSVSEASLSPRDAEP